MSTTLGCASIERSALAKPLYSGRDERAIGHLRELLGERPSTRAVSAKNVTSGLRSAPFGPSVRAISLVTLYESTLRETTCEPRKA
jgi:hypothetical protein